jgi:hypothetical protein
MGGVAPRQLSPSGAFGQGGVKDTRQEMMEEITAMHEDRYDLKRSRDILIGSDAAQGAAINTRTRRATRLEKRVGLAN